MDDRVRKMRQVIRDAARNGDPEAVVGLHPPWKRSRRRRTGKTLRVLGALTLLAAIPIPSDVGPEPQPPGSVRAHLATAPALQKNGILKYSAGAMDPSRYVVDGLLKGATSWPDQTGQHDLASAEEGFQVF